MKHTQIQFDCPADGFLVALARQRIPLTPAQAPQPAAGVIFVPHGPLVKYPAARASSTLDKTPFVRGCGPHRTARVKVGNLGTSLGSFNRGRIGTTSAAAMDRRADKKTWEQARKMPPLFLPTINVRRTPRRTLPRVGGRQEPNHGLQRTEVATLFCAILLSPAALPPTSPDRSLAIVYRRGIATNSRRSLV